MNPHVQHATDFPVHNHRNSNDGVETLVLNNVVVFVGDDISPRVVAHADGSARGHDPATDSTARVDDEVLQSRSPQSYPRTNLQTIIRQHSSEHRNGNARRSLQ